jgi:DNA-binding NarL/FixJ family response regulator
MSSRTEGSTLRAQGAYLDAAARSRSVPGESHLEPVPEWTSADKPLGLVWVLTPSYTLIAAGLEKALEGRADVRIGGDSVAAGGPSCIVLYADGMEDGFLDRMRRVHELYPDVPLLVCSARLDPALACAALRNGAAGFVHAAMEGEQVLKAVEVAQKGELAAPRELIPYLLGQELGRDGSPEVGDLSVRQREVMTLVAEGESNAEIAGHLYVSESTIKQHLRCAYRLLGVRNRTEAAKTVNNHLRAL